MAILIKIVTETPPRPRELRPDLPPWLEAVVLRAMQREPAARYGSCEEMLDALDREAAGLHLSVAPEREPPPATMSTAEYRLVSLLCVQHDASADVGGAVAAALERAGAVVYRLLGGRVIGIFGLERTRGGEALQAVQAGLEVRAAVGEAVRMLAATFHLQVGEGFRLSAGELDAFAEALVGLPPGELVLDPATRDLVGDRIGIRRVAGHDLVSAVKPGDPARRRVLGVETPTVGRRTELAAIRAAFELAREEREPEVVLVLGAAGMGKSRLVRDLLPELQAEALCFDARPRPHGASSPYSLLADAIALLAGIHVGQDAAAQARALKAFVRRVVEQAGDRREVTLFLAEALGITIAGGDAALEAARSDPRLMRARITWALTTLIAGAASRRSVVLLLEDLHLADEESLQLLELLLDQLEGLPLFLLATARPELLERHTGIFRRAAAARLELQPLGQRPLRRLLRAIMGPVPPDFEELVAGWCDGNPYFIEELVSWLVVSEAIAHDADGWRLAGDPRTLELPASLEGAIQGRLDGLAPELKELLKMAAVLGEVFWEGGCEALGALEPAQALARLEEAECIAPRPSSRIADDREWIFRHALLHQVAYGMLPRDRRRSMHLEAARWLERSGERDAALLAHHYGKGATTSRRPSTTREPVRARCLTAIWSGPWPITAQPSRDLEQRIRANRSSVWWGWRAPVSWSAATSWPGRPSRASPRARMTPRSS